MPTAAEIHAWPMARDANIAALRQALGKATRADAHTLAAFDRKVQRLGGTLAYDAAMTGQFRRGGLGDQGGEAGDPAEFLAWLRERLNPADMGEAEQMLARALGAEPLGGHAPEPFSGRPRVGGG